jgi:Domain of unknown function (DUF4372)/Transposase DDE domain
MSFGKFISARRTSALNRVCSIFSQLLQLFPRSEFELAVHQHQAERHARGFSSWGQMVAMLFCQIGRAQSLREICGGLAACEGKLRHLGVSESPKRSTLAYANAHRPWQLYQTVFGQLLDKCQREVRGSKKFRFKNKLLSLDGSVIDLSATMYDWAKFRQTKGGVKLHLLLDHDGYLPKYAVIEPARKAEIKVARKLPLEPGTILVFDRGYTDYKWFARLTKQGVYFVTRQRWNGYYRVVKQRKVPEHGNILADQWVLLGHRSYRTGVAVRRVVVRDPETDKQFEFLTNHPGFAASTIAKIYRDRWQIEVFFKALKQSLRIKTFVGTSANALKTQIWTALIAMLVLKYLKLKSSYGWSLSNLVALLRQQLFVYRDLWTWLNDPFEPPPALQGLHDQLQLTF